MTELYNKNSSDLLKTNENGGKKDVDTKTAYGMEFLEHVRNEHFR